MTAQHFRIVLFAVFMLVFLSTAALTIAGVGGWNKNIRTGHLNTLVGTLLVESIVAVIALFKNANFFGSDSPPTTTAPVHPLPYLSPRTAALNGAWKGTANQAFGPDGKPLEAEVVFTFNALKPVITGTGSFRVVYQGQTTTHRFEFAGGFLFERFLRFEYNSIDPSRIQFGSIVLELEGDSTTLSGHYQGYGTESKKIVYGDLKINKVV